jgi:O-antigen/teichoic acid export membrane protein
MNRTLLSALGAVFSGRIAIFVAGALITPLLTRLLGPAAYGQYATILAIFSLVKILMVSGIDVGAKKYLSEERSIENWKNYVWTCYVRWSLAWGGIFSLAIAALAYEGFVAAFLGSEYVILFYLLTILAFSTQFRTLCLSSLMGLHLEKYSEPLKVIEKVSFGVIAVFLAYRGFGVRGVMVGQISSVLLTLAISLLILRRHIDVLGFFWQLPDKFPKSELIWFNNSSIVYVFFLSSLYHVDVLVLKMLTGEELVGYYKAALVIVGLLWLFPKSLQQVLIQSVSELWRSDSVTKINSLSSKTTRYVLLITVLLSIGLAVLADIFIPFYFGQDYAPAVEPLLILLPGTICFAIARPSLAITNAKGDMMPLIIATGIGAGINLLLNLLFIPLFGILGAAVATTVGYTSLLVAQVICARYVGYNPVSGIRPVRIAITGILTGVSIYYVKTLAPEPTIALVTVPPIGGVLFGLFAIWTGAITFEEIRSIGSRFGVPF